MIRSWSGCALGIAVATATPTLAAQSASLDAGRAAMVAAELPTARRHLEEAVARDPGSYEANWRLALVVLDIGKQMRDQTTRPARDSLYALSEKYARRAVAANSRDADGHFALANALGRSALTRGTRERIRIAAEVKREAELAIAIDPKHHGALHVLGRWHAEVKGLSGAERFVARNFLGGGVLGEASWDEAERNLRASVRYGPEVIYHHLDLAEVLVTREKWSEARAELDMIATMPPHDPMDPLYKDRARELRAKIASRIPR